MKLRFDLFLAATVVSSFFRGVSAGKKKFSSANNDKFVPADPEFAIEGEYIIIMKEPKTGFNSAGTLGSFSDKTIKAFAEEMAGKANPKIKTIGIFSNAIKGYAVRGLSEAHAKKITKDKRVQVVEQNAYVSVEEAWGLDRVDQRDLPLDDETYSPTEDLDGSGVTAYIIDTGIRITHNEFKDEASGDQRARWGTNTSGDDEDFDCNGHGTHVAGTVGGSKYGVAKNAKLVAVKVLNCEGSGTYAGVIKGIEWAIKDAIGKKATANLSLGGPTSQAVDLAVRNLHNSGVPTVVAAGNENKDACTASPARERSVITVGSSTKDDVRSSFSNYGECVDIFAPGSDITASWIGGDDDVKTISGTSMASPHVCGAVALLLESGIDAASVDEELVNRGTDNKLTDAGNGSPNKLLFIGKNGATNPPTPAPPTPAPTPCSSPPIKIEVKTDEYPDETSWKLVNNCDETEQLAKHPGFYENEDHLHIDEECVPEAQYTFTIADTWNDGMCCDFDVEGGYKVVYKEAVVAEGGKFKSSESTTFGSCPTSDKEWDVLFQEDFEQARGKIKGPMSKKVFYRGGQSLKLGRIRDKGRTSKHNVRQYSELMIEFYVKFTGLENGEGIILKSRSFPGKKVTNVAEWLVGEEYENGKWFKMSATAGTNGAKKLKLSFKRTGDTPHPKRSSVHIDDVVFSGHKAN